MQIIPVSVVHNNTVIFQFKHSKMNSPLFISTLFACLCASALGLLRSQVNRQLASTDVATVGHFLKSNERAKWKTSGSCCQGQ